MWVLFVRLFWNVSVCANKMCHANHKGQQPRDIFRIYDLCKFLLARFVRGI